MAASQRSSLPACLLPAATSRVLCCLLRCMLVWVCPVECAVAAADAAMLSACDVRVASQLSLSRAELSCCDELPRLSLRLPRSLVLSMRYQRCRGGCPVFSFELCLLGSCGAEAYQRSSHHTHRTSCSRTQRYYHSRQLPLNAAIRNCARMHRTHTAPQAKSHNFRRQPIFHTRLRVTHSGYILLLTATIYGQHQYKFHYDSAESCTNIQCVPHADGTHLKRMTTKTSNCHSQSEHPQPSQANTTSGARPAFSSYTNV